MVAVFRHVNSGGSFGANPLRQEIGLGAATSIDILEIFWPKTGLTQTFRDVALDQALEITEGQDRYRRISLSGGEVESDSPGAPEALQSRPAELDSSLSRFTQRSAGRAISRMK